MWIDLGQPYFNGMPCSAPHGVPHFGSSILWQHEDGCQISIGQMQMGAHTGTHVDAERHFFPNGRTIDDYPADAFVGQGIVLDLPCEGPVEVSADDLLATRCDIRHGDIVFLRFGFGNRFRERSYFTHPFLAVEAANLLIDRGVRLIGVDTLTPDRPHEHRDDDFDFPVHRTLLGAGVPIVENLGPGLAVVAGRRLTLGAIPLRIEGGDGAPVTAFALDHAA